MASDACMAFWPQRALGMVLGVTAIAALSGCADFSGIASASRTVDAQTMGLANPTLSAPQDSTLPADTWWQTFGDAQLNRLVDQALADSPSLRVAQARLARAQAGSDNADAAGKPQVNGSLDMSRQRFTALGIYPPPIGGSVLNLATLQASASWEWDFFGKNRAALEAAVGQVRAAQADAEAARLLLASQVAHSYLQWARWQQQTALQEAVLDQRTQLRTLVQDRVHAGLDTALELQQADSALAEARLQREVLREQGSLSLQALAAWIGKPNSTPALDLPGPYAIKIIAIDVPLPINLLGRRADVRAALWRVEAARSEVDAAQKQFYPNINLTAFAGFSSVGFDRLLQNGSDQWGVGPAVRLPLFDQGHLRAALKGRTADFDAAVESYNALVIDAVHDARDQWTSVQAIARQHAEQALALAHAEAGYEIALARYRAGLGNNLAVLAAQAQVLAQRRQITDLAARALDAQVQLMRAMGGSLSADLPTSPLLKQSAP